MPPEDLIAPAARRALPDFTTAQALVDAGFLKAQDLDPLLAEHDALPATTVRLSPGAPPPARRPNLQRDGHPRA